jgi:hypothetical protein
MSSRLILLTIPKVKVSIILNNMNGFWLREDTIKFQGRNDQYFLYYKNPKTAESDYNKIITTVTKKSDDTIILDADRWC